MPKNTILIVEDEEISQFYLDELIKDFNINNKIYHAKNGQEAVDICKKTKDINLVLMDIKMPVMDGYEATKQIKQFLPDLPIIAQSAIASNIVEEKAISAGCISYITKPFQEDIIFKLFNKYLQS